MDLPFVNETIEEMTANLTLNGKNIDFKQDYTIRSDTWLLDHVGYDFKYENLHEAIYICKTKKAMHQ
ncbi:hypothetical protein A3Q56_08236 [Intoshia linei]|uniref:Uncharacterized protein n=1 Tax=Intoshia linei TaxID=1819745 RepID=A0A177APW3_9BILA|nr:hypothetical protein A3Q56_08236 [Intoshia linei]